MARMLLLLTVLLTGCTSWRTVTNIETDDIVQSRIDLGLAYLNEGQWQRARQHIEAAVLLSPENSDARMAYAYYLQQVNEIEQAGEQYALALKLDPNDPDLLNNYGTFLCHNGKYNLAEQAFSSAIKQKGYYKLSSTFENAGLCAVKSKNWLSAKKWFKKALDHEPNRYLSTLYLVQIEMTEKAFSQARQRLYLFHQEYGYRAPTLLTMIKLQRALGKKDQSEKYVQLLAEQFPQSQEYRQYLDNEF